MVMRIAMISVSRAVSGTAIGIFVCVLLVAALRHVAETAGAAEAALWALVGVALVVMARGEDRALESVEEDASLEAEASWHDYDGSFRGMVG
jgi:hypothetical protein